MKTLLFSLFLFFSACNGFEVYVHIMPWFETKNTNNGAWGQHWTMANKNPDNIVNGKPDIASFYHPKIGPYASGDPDVIDWQLGTIKAAGISGVFIDWPGTYNKFDYAKNVKNAEAIIAGTERNGLKFAIVYEDNNLNLASVPDKIGQGTLDMAYLQKNYFLKSNYVHINEKPLLMDFGPQVLFNNQWNQIFTPINPKPAFLTLWNQHSQGGSYCEGEYAWVWKDFLQGLTQWYQQVKVNIPIGVAYPGFRPFYSNGGWGGPTWTIDYSANTFQQTFNLAVQHTNIIQICTWNDYGEGTIIEPTVEFGTTFVKIIRKATGSKYTSQDFEELSQIFLQRKQNVGNSAKLEELRLRHQKIVRRFG